jgi:hypoxanthine phosphoribosyltransferase
LLTRFEKLTWTEFDDACKKIARFARKKQEEGTKITEVYGIPRGGLGMALRISHLLDIPLIVDEGKISKHTLVVDEICDTGKTLEEFARLHKENFALVATIYHKEGASYTPDFYLKLKTDKWVLFPWETAKTTWMEDE